MSSEPPTVSGPLRARQAEHEAITAQSEAVAEARAAVEARDEADAVANFLVGLFAAANTQALEADKPPGEISALELRPRKVESHSWSSDDWHGRDGRGGGRTSCEHERTELPAVQRRRLSRTVRHAWPSASVSIE